MEKISIKVLFKGCLILIYSLLPLSLQAKPIFSDPLTSLDGQFWSLADGWANGYPFINHWASDAVQFDNTGMSITLSESKQARKGRYQFQSGEIRTHFFFNYGCFEIDMIPISEPGIVTSFFLFMGPDDKDEEGSGVHNEIDIEFLGQNTNQVQLNFWTNDDSYSSKNEIIIKTGFDASQSFQRYAIHWTEEFIEWYINNESVLKIYDTEQTPLPKVDDGRLRVIANVWATDNRISHWAGRFDTSSRDKYTAKYRNFSYSRVGKCSSQ